VVKTLGISRAWLARAYRWRRGDGLGAALRRRRVERAMLLLEQSRLPLASVAAEVGFCDQSHMNRAFQVVLGRTPATLRSQPLGLAEAAGR